MPRARDDIDPDAALATSRRGFLKWSALLGGTAALGGGGLLLTRDPAGSSSAGSLGAAGATSGGARIFRTANTPECLHCALLAHVEDGRLVKVTGDPDFNILACARGISRIRQLYSPHRLKYPMRRAGRRGEDKWERISWEEALDTIAERYRRILDEDGNQAFLSFGSTGNWSTFSTGVRGIYSAFWNRFGGATPIISQLCCASVTEGFNAVFGGGRSEFRDEWVHSRFFLAWGNNPAVSNQGYMKNLFQAREEHGARLVTIDPRLSETAALSDRWIQIRPGTDAALALGMVKVLLDEELFDEEYVRRYTNAPFLVRLGDGGYDLPALASGWPTGGDALPVDLRELELLTDGRSGAGRFLVWDERSGRPVPVDTPGVRPALSGSYEIGGARYQPVFEWLRAIAARYTPEIVHRLTGAPADVVAPVTREYAATRPAAIIQNMAGAQRTDHGTLTVIGHLYLASLTGNVGLLGGGVNDNGGFLGQGGTINYPVPLQRNEPIDGIPATKLGEYLLERKPHPIRAIHVAGTGVLTQYPNTRKIIAGLDNVESVVVQDIFMTTTARYADIVLPATTIFETRSLLAGIRSRYIQLMQQAIEPLFEARSDRWIMTELAKRLGFGDDFDKPDDEILRHVLEPTGVSLEQLEEGPVNPMPDPWIPFADKRFNTQSGRIELFSLYLQGKGFAPLLEYEHPVEAPWVDETLAARYPLQLINRKNHNHVNSSFHHHDFLTEIWARQVLQIHPDDAKARGIEHGGRIRVFNDRGEIEAMAEVSRGIMRGVVSVTTGWGGVDEKQTASILSPDKYEPISLGHTLNSSMVEVARGDGANVDAAKGDAA